MLSINLSQSTLQVKTQSQMAVLFYNTGPSSNQDFVALEIWKGRPRLLVDQVITSVYDNGFLNTVTYIRCTQKLELIKISLRIEG